jgi:hypothetical protein
MPRKPRGAKRPTPGDIEQTDKLHKTSIAVPAALWRDLRIAAIEDGDQAQRIIARLIEQYLAQRRKRGPGR